MQIPVQEIGGVIKVLWGKANGQYREIAYTAYY